MGLHDGVKTKVEKGFTYLEEFEIKNGIHQEFVLLPLLFPIVADVIT